MADRTIIKKNLDEWLDDVDYEELLGGYVPSVFALTFMNFIKLVNGEEGESHKTPPVHLKMLDKVTEKDATKIANLCFRGAAKTTLFFEYMILFIAVYGYLPGLGDVTGMIYVSDSMENGVASARKNIEFRYNSSEFLQKWLPKEGVKFTDKYLEFTNTDGHKLGCKMFGAKTGLRGTKIFGKRPVLAVLDDLVSDDDARSTTAMNSIKDTVYKGVNHALDPTRRKIIFNGTPFNKMDIMIEAVESGAWDVNVWPVCERFPCTEEEFVGAWEDRFTYAYIKEQYDDAVLLGKVAGFMQELMLRITSEEERLVQDAEIRWYSRTKLLQSKHQYNFYITTDFATSEAQAADYSVISVWAYNAQGDWFWVDGMAKRQTIDLTFKDLFRYVQMYKPMEVGVEVTGQQQAYIKLLQGMMMDMNIWFNFASSEKSRAPGIRPVTNKLSRFNLVVPWFKAGKVYWPEEMKLSEVMKMFMQQIAFATVSGLKGKDDCIDTISMLGYLNAVRPSETEKIVSEDHDTMWDDPLPEEPSALASYIV